MKKNGGLDERFGDAVELLASELNETSYPAHLGAISALRNLAITGEEYTQRCLDIICSCNEWMGRHLHEFNSSRGDGCYAIRRLTDNNRIAKDAGSITSANPPKVNSKKKKAAERNDLITLSHEKRSQAALQAVSHIIREIKQEELHKLDFSHKMLCGINLAQANIDKINLSKVYLSGANLAVASVREGRLLDAHLEGANLVGANLQGAWLNGANLQGAWLNNANMQEAFLYEANLQGASLLLTQLQKSQPILS